MSERKRKYYRVKVHRIPPYSMINSDYYFKEDVCAYSENGAFESVINYHSKGYGSNIPVEAKEIPKEEFKGSHHIEM